MDVRAAFSDSHGEENNFKVAGRQESESGLSALLALSLSLRRSHLCGKCSEKPLMVIRSAVAAPVSERGAHNATRKCAGKQPPGGPKLSNVGVCCVAGFLPVVS